MDREVRGGSYGFEWTESGGMFSILLIKKKRYFALIFTLLLQFSDFCFGIHLKNSAFSKWLPKNVCAWEKNIVLSHPPLSFQMYKIRCHDKRNIVESGLLINTNNCITSNYRNIKIFIEYYV